MRRYLLLGALVLSTAPAHGQLNKLPVSSTMPGDVFSRVLSQTALYFVTNQGQVDNRVYYYVRGRDRDVFVTEDGLTLLLRPPPTAQSRDMASPVSFRGRTFAEEPAGGAAFAVRLEFVDARPHAKPQAEGTQGPLVNLFTGGQNNWRTGIPTTSGLVYKDLWPGIDLALVGDTQRINYEFRVKPGADPDQIRMRYRGGALPRLEPSGDLAIDTPLGTLRDQRPFSYQESGGQRTEVESRYALAASEDGSFGFALSGYDRTKLLVIDPAVFVYASYLGGAGEDRASAVAVDASGAAYITGDTTSSESTFPTGTGFGFIPGVDRIHNGGYDAFVAKVHPSGTGLEYVTYVGGSGADQGQDIAVDGAGSVYVTGQTNSGELFPTVRGPRTVYAGGARDVFVFKLDPSGTVLLYSGFIGGADDDRESNIAIDTYGSAYVTGLTYSSESTFPTGTGFGSLPGADQTHNGDADAFVVKVSPDGSSLQFASYIGGSAFDQGYSVGIDAARNVYVGGNVGSNENTFPDGDGVGTIPGPDTTYNGGGFDAFVVKLNPEGTSFAYVAFVGGAGGSERDERYATGFAVDPQGSAWIAGGRASAEDTFPTGQGFGSIPGFDRTSNGGRDGFLVKINSAGTAFDYATYIGGSGEDDAQRMTVDRDGNAYVTGWTSSNGSTFPDGDGFGDIPGPDTSYNGGPHDIFVVKLNAEGTGLWYATYIGGPGEELGTGIALDASSNAYVVGYTNSTNSFPGGSGFGSLPGFDLVHNGGGLDAFIVKIGPPSSTPTAGAGPDQSVQVGATATLQGSGSCPSGSPVPTWSFIGMPPGSAATLSDINAWRPTIVADVAGFYTLELVVFCGADLGTARVHVSATDCTGYALQASPSLPQALLPGQSQVFRGYGGAATYNWSLVGSTDGTVSPATGQSTTYVARSTPGIDFIRMHDTYCGDVDVAIAVVATLGPEPNGPPQVSPSPTQGATFATVYASFPAPVDHAEVCIGTDGSPEPGTCRELGGAGAFRFGQLPTAPSVATDALNWGSHTLRVRGEIGGVWGSLSAPARLDVSEKVAILLINGYNFCTTGPHPEQWWEFRDNSRTIPCQIRDYFFHDDQQTDCKPTGSGVNCNTSDGPVCVVNNIDGREQIFDDSVNGITGTLTQLENYISDDPWLDAVGHYILIGHSYGGQIARAYAAAHPEKVVAVIAMDTPHVGIKWGYAEGKKVFDYLKEHLKVAGLPFHCANPAHEDRALPLV